jgi:hypothetical protein
VADWVISEIERHIDGALRSLPLFRRPRYQAISAIQIGFELGVDEFVHRLGALSPALIVNVLNYKPAAALLAREAWSNCPVDEDDPSPIAFEEYLELAGEAFHFAVIYNTLSEVFPLIHQNHLKAECSGRQVRLSYVSPKARSHDALNSLAQAYRPQLRGRIDRDGAARVSRELRELVEKDMNTGGPFKTLEISPQTLSKAVEFAEINTMRAALPGTLNCGSYDLDSFRLVFLALKAITSIGISARGPGGPPVLSREAVWGPEIWHSRKELINRIVQLMTLKRDIVEVVIEDMTFNPDDSRDDLEISPIIERGDQVWMAPNIVQTYRWEDNVLRLWNARHPAEYSRTIASAKSGLASEVAESLAGNEFVVATERIISDSDGRAITDVDVGVAAPDENRILLIEAKWPVSPANAKETGKADTEVAKGFRQLERAREEVIARGNSVLKQIFPDSQVATWRIDQIDCVQFVRGLYPSAAIEMMFPVVPADPAIDYLRQSKGATLRELTTTLTEPPERRLLSGFRHFDGVYTIAGYEFQVPQWSWADVMGDIPAEQRKKADRNARCPCGSGVKYRRCCWLATGSKYYTRYRSYDRIVPGG